MGRKRKNYSQEEIPGNEEPKAEEIAGEAANPVSEAPKSAEEPGSEEKVSAKVEEPSAKPKRAAVKFPGKYRKFQ